jgi:hypothetical protein
VRRGKPRLLLSGAGGLTIGAAYLLLAIWVVEVVLVRPDETTPNKSSMQEPG